jgi:uncharacterized membrane protein
MPDVTSAAANETASRERFAWLDMARGAALPAMASYHFLWDLAYFGYIDADFPSTGWPRLYARAIASTFLFLAGFSLYLAHRNGIRWPGFRRRFARIVAAAAVVTIGTYLVMPQGFVFFGILHQIALASLLGLLFLRVPVAITVAVALVVIAVPQFYTFEALDPPWFWWTGLSASTRVSFDYVPLFPWFGPFLLGMAAGRLFARPPALRQNALGISTTNPRKMAFAFLGRHSLVFYLVHQPVLIAMLFLFSILVPAPKADPGRQYIKSCVNGCKDGQSPAFCQRFCGCTLEMLQAQNLLAPLQSGAISVDNDERLNGIAMQCSSGPDD